MEIRNSTNSTIVRCEGTTTFSNIVGNLTSFASTFFQSKFPKGFFKKVLISESLTSMHINRKDLISYNTPLMVIKPELSLDSTYMETLPRWYTDHHYISKSKKDYVKVLADEENRIFIYCVPTRIKVNFSVRIKVPTAMFMYNTMQSIQNMFEVGGYEFINKVRLQTEVPKIMMISLAESLGYNLSAIDGREDFNNYLSKNTFNGIEESINLSTGNSMYGYNFITNILANYPDVVQGDKNMKNLVVKNGLISFSFGLELWIPNRFFLELPNNRAEIKNEIYNSEENDRFKFNMVFNMDYIMPKIDSKHLINRKSFLPDVNVEYDVLDISSIINTEIDSVIKSMISKNLFSTEYFEIKIMCGNRLLRDMEYSVDYNNYIIKTYEPMSNTTYTILIYGDLEVLNNISKKLANKEDYSMIEKK